MKGQRVTWAAAERLAGRLSARDWAIIHSLADSRVLSGEQLSRLHFVELSHLTQHRTRRRVLTRLTDWHVLTRLERTIGGVHAGSSGWVYALGPAGQRLSQRAANQQGMAARIRTPWTPGTLFLKHSLDVAEVYVQLTEASRSGEFSLTRFETEPAYWWPDGLGGFLKPDAYLVLSTAGYDELIWLEVDRATESLPTLRRKLTAYANFVARGQLGPSGVIPHVVISTPTPRRTDAVRAIAESVDQTGGIFRVTNFASAAGQLIELAIGSPEEPP